MSNPILPLSDYLAPLEEAVAELAQTWHPEDPAYRAELYRQVMMHLSYGYFLYFTADAEHPDWSPLYNSVFSCQPNPDDVYWVCPLRDDRTYRISGRRGTSSKLIFVTQRGKPGGIAEIEECGSVNSFDETDIVVAPDGKLEILLSAERPKHLEGNWFPLLPGTDTLMVRSRMIDWANETDAQLAIECIDPRSPKARLVADEIIDRIKQVARVPFNQNKMFYGMQNQILKAVGHNVIHPVRYPGLDRQLYWPAVYQVEEDEALIVETEMPRVAPYWNIQLNDPLFNAVEFIYRISSLNASTAEISSDGKLRAVIAHTDPGVPNWLDPAGFNEGTLYGRWYDCDSLPIPVIRRVKLARLREHLPVDTRTITVEEREAQLRTRVRAAQLRRRW